MQEYRQALAYAISSEAKAYGFTLVVWSSGALQFSRTSPGVWHVFAFLGGALLSMGIVVLLAFRGVRSEVPVYEAIRHSWGAIHVVSVIVAILAGWGLSLLVPPSPWSYFLDIFVAILLFQLLLAAEDMLSVRTIHEERHLD